MWYLSCDFKCKVDTHIGRASASELQMLDLTPEKTTTSRLACQVQISEDMDGMHVQLPEYQM